MSELPSQRTGCIDCGTDFPLNAEIASIPQGTKIAFDPVRNRVWRVCGKCGAWNLLGEEASRSATPELEMRYQAGMIRHSEGVSVARIGSALELIRLEKTPLHRRDDLAAASARRMIMVVPLLLILIPVVALLFVPPGRLTLHLIVVIVSEVLAPYAFAEFSMGIRLLRFRKRVSWPTVIVALSIFLAATFLPYWGNPHAELANQAMLYAAVAVVLFFAPSRIQSERLHDGRILQLERAYVPDISIAWTTHGEISLYDLPEGIHFTAEETLPMLRALLNGSRQVWQARPLLSRRSVEFLRSVGGLYGLLAALEGFRRDQDGRVRLGDLPPMYRYALEFAIAPTRGSDEATAARLREEAHAANLVAVEAQNLKRDLRLSEPT